RRRGGLRRVGYDPPGRRTAGESPWGPTFLPMWSWTIYSRSRLPTPGRSRRTTGPASQIGSVSRRCCDLWSCVYPDSFHLRTSSNALEGEWSVSALTQEEVIRILELVDKLESSSFE